MTEKLPAPEPRAPPLFGTIKPLDVMWLRYQWRMVEHMMRQANTMVGPYWRVTAEKNLNEYWGKINTLVNPDGKE